jgi:hypothetical protein
MNTLSGSTLNGDSLLERPRLRHPLLDTVISFLLRFCLYYISDGVLGAPTTLCGSLHWLGLISGQINLLIICIYGGWIGPLGLLNVPSLIGIRKTGGLLDCTISFVMHLFVPTHFGIRL